MMNRIDQIRRRRMVVLAAFDGACWLAAVLAIVGLMDMTGISLPHSFAYGVLLGVASALLHLVIGMTVRLHQGRAALASFEDAVLLATVVGVVGVAGVVGNLLLGHQLRTLVTVAAPVFALVLMFWGRATYRMQSERWSMQRSRRAADREPVVVIGAGEAGRQLVSSMLRDPNQAWVPRALVDDDLLKRHRRIRGVPVLGRLHDLSSVADQVGATSAILAMPSANADLVVAMGNLARESGLLLKVLPGNDDLRDPNHVTIRDVRDIDVTDLLGRHVIETDIASIADYLTGKRVLVTGAGGSIGSELCRQIAKFNPSELIMLDRDESALHAVELSIHGKAMLDTDETVLGDIRDTQFVLDLFRDRRPEVVFHAAALKHLPLLEKAPGEAVKTNVWGTLAILQAAKTYGVERFVNISTDKAANPCSVLGYSKRLAEGLTASIAPEADGTYLSVRFGNVLGSRGSVLTAFASQIASGGPVTVTDRAVTRFFMTIREAVQLVIQAAAIGSDGEVLVLDMGDPISIDTVARQLIELSGERVDIVYTGLRPGEKMHEELFGEGEVDARPRHPQISHTLVPAHDPDQARALDPWANPKQVTDALAVACLDMQMKVVQA